jgi:hypothetical protein
MSQELIPTHRLSLDAYRQLLTKLPKIGVPRTAEEACTMVGIQMVLSLLREGYVVGEA